MALKQSFANLLSGLSFMQFLTTDFFNWRFFHFSFLLVSRFSFLNLCIFLYLLFFHFSLPLSVTLYCLNFFFYVWYSYLFPVRFLCFYFFSFTFFIHFRRIWFCFQFFLYLFLLLIFFFVLYTVFRSCFTIDLVYHSVSCCHSFPFSSLFVTITFLFYGLHFFCILSLSSCLLSFSSLSLSSVLFSPLLYGFLKPAIFLLPRLSPSPLPMSSKKKIKTTIVRYWPPFSICLSRYALMRQKCFFQ